MDFLSKKNTVLRTDTAHKHLRLIKKKHNKWEHIHVLSWFGIGDSNYISVYNVSNT